MNIYKKLTAVFLALLMFLSIAPAQCFAAAETENAESTSETAQPPDEENIGEESTDEDLITVDGITYRLTNEEAFIVGAEDLSGSIELPSEVEGLPVTRICEKALYACKDITGIVIPETVIAIEDYAFTACVNLNSVKITGDGVDIGQSVFNNTAAYSVYNKYKEPIYIDNYLVDGNYLDSTVKQVTLKEETRGIAKKAFLSCNDLVKIKIPSRNCRIYDDTYTIHTKIKIYGYRNSAAEEYALKYARTFLLYCIHTQTKEYPETETACTAIGYTAGVRCEECGEWLSGHEIKTGIHHRDENEDGICDDCENKITKITYKGKCGDAAYFVLYDNQTLIIDGTGAIDSNMFWGTSNIKKLVIGEGITSIGSGAFGHCVTEITLPETLITIGTNAFYQSDFESVKLPESLISIGNGAFQESGLKEIEIGKNVKSIGENAFFLSDIERITVSPENDYFSSDEDGVLFTKNKSVLLCYPTKKSDGEYTLPPEVKKIEKNAFSHSSVKKVVFPEGIEEIGLSAFEYSRDLISINLPQSLDIISSRAFYCCASIAELELPEQLSVLGSYAFYNVGTNNGLRSLRIPGGIKSIGIFAFSGCSNLTYLTLEEGIEEIGSGAFNNTSIIKAEIPGSLRSYQGIFSSYNKTLRELVFAEGIKEIYTQQFAYLDALESVTLPDSLVKIGYGAFYACGKLRKVRFPEKLVSIGPSAFAYCRSLTDIEFGESLETIEYCAFEYCDKITCVTLSSNIKTVEASAFKNCASLEEVIFNDKLQSIGNSAFEGTALKGDLVFPESLRCVGKSAFYSLSNIGSITLNDGLTEIGEKAFYAAINKAESLVIPDSVTKMGAYAFACCRSLKSIKVSENIDTISSYAFSYCSSLENPILPSSLKKISSGVFSNCTSLVTVDIPKSVTFIGSSAFAKCSALENITLPDGIGSVSSSLFSECTALEEITVPDSVKTIGSEAFYHCTALKKIDLGKSVTVIKSGAFQKCRALESIELPESLISIESLAFSGLTSLSLGRQEVTIPASCERIEASAFADSYYIKIIKLNEGLKYIGVAAFNNTSATEITIPSTVKTLYGTFKDNNDIEKVVINNGTEIIAADAFSGATELTQVILPDSIHTIGVNAFKNCTGVHELTLPDNIKKIDKTAFTGCTNLTKIKVNKNSITYNTLLAAGVDEKLLVCRHDVSPGSPSSGECSFDYDCPHCGQKIPLYHESHSIVIEQVVAPTCSDTGLSEGSHCAVCGKVIVEQEVIPKLAHTVVADKAVAPTCTGTGLSEGSHCAVCGKIIVAQKPVDKAPHTVVTDKAVAPTCMSTGLSEGSHCAVCGEVLAEQKTIAKTYHKIVTDAAVAPTENDPGLTEGSHCAVCGLIIVKQQVIDADEYSIITNGSNDTVTAKQINKATQTANGNIKKVVFYGKGKSAVNETRIYKIGKVTLSETVYIYDGKEHKPKVSVKDSRGNTIASKYYTLKYSDSAARYPGKYTVTVTFSGNYSGKKVLSFTVAPAKVSSLKVTSPSKKTASVSYAKMSGVSGFEIYYSSSKDKGFKKLTATAKTSYTYKKFSSGKTLYFKVRAYKTVGDSKIYGSFSSVRSLKIK